MTTRRSFLQNVAASLGAIACPGFVRAALRLPSKEYENPPPVRLCMDGNHFLYNNWRHDLCVNDRPFTHPLTGDVYPPHKIRVANFRWIANGPNLNDAQCDVSFRYSPLGADVAYLGEDGQKHRVRVYDVADHNQLFKGRKCIPATHHSRLRRYGTAFRPSTGSRCLKS